MNDQQVAEILVKALCDSEIYAMPGYIDADALEDTIIQGHYDMVKVAGRVREALLRS